jgi:aryl-alcohol dehydrogenase-like predicted oxidoreductase
VKEIVFLPSFLSFKNHFQVSKLGFGCMGLTGVYNSPLSEEAGIAIIKEAFNKGITFFDTADVYGPKTNEILLGKVYISPLCLSVCFFSYE